MKFKFKFPWYGLQMSFEGPQIFRVTTLDHCVKASSRKVWLLQDMLLGHRRNALGTRTSNF